MSHFGKAELEGKKKNSILSQICAGTVQEVTACCARNKMVITHTRKEVN